MRNLAEYPVTKDEIADCLTTLQDEIGAKELIGDMRPYLLGIAAGIVAGSDWKPEEL